MCAIHPCIHNDLSHRILADYSIPVVVVEKCMNESEKKAAPVSPLKVGDFSAK